MASRLSKVITVYQEEHAQHETEIKRLRAERTALLALTRQMRNIRVTNSFVETENSELKKLSMSKQRSLESEHNKLRSATKQIENLEKLNQELCAINERYRLDNDKLLEAREALQRQLANLTTVANEFQCEVQQLRAERAMQMGVAEENNALRQEIAALSPQTPKHGRSMTQKISVGAHQ